MTPQQEKDFSRRAILAHNRMHGQSTWIEAHAMKIADGVAGGLPHWRVRVADHELNIVTYWDVVAFTGRRRIRFYKQYGERA